ncbi:uncharacterized protein LOC102444119 [Pelodiscus sinensis]|uniref:uncharacterized protein LOC102444119 n=1 Tax=Pelodiscus sinensis TaxID=13735 RepID=UPI003F6D09A3
MLRKLFSGVRIPVVISLRWVPKGHTWRRNLNWTKMKENCIHFVFLYKKCCSCIVIFLIFGLLLLPDWTASTTISNRSDPVPNTTNTNFNTTDHVSKPTNTNCNVKDWIQIPILIVIGLNFISCIIYIFYKPEHCVSRMLYKVVCGVVTCSSHPSPRHGRKDPIQIPILILIGLNFIMSAIDLCINYKLQYCVWIQIPVLLLVGPNLIFRVYVFCSKPNHRKKYDVEQGLLPDEEENEFTQEENGKLLEANRQLQIEKEELQEINRKLQESINQLQIEKGKQLESNQKPQEENGKLLEINRQLQIEKEKYQKELEWRKARNNIDDIILAADTAHPNLSIAWDKKSLKHETQPQKVPPNPKRFDATVCVLGSEGFSSGKHYWEVDVRSSTDWDLGVARKSIARKGKLSLSPKEGFWVLSLSGRDYWAKTDPWTRVMVQKKPKKIGVYVSYQEGQVTFFNVTGMTVLFTFSDCSFSGEICPFFKNSHKETTLKICSIKEEE